MRQFLDKASGIVAAVKKILRRTKHDHIGLLGSRNHRLARDRLPASGRTASAGTQQQLQFPYDASARRRIDRLLRLGSEDPVTQAIHASQQHVGAFGSCLCRTLTETVQHGFHLVRQFGDDAKSQATRGPLQRMYCAENAIQGFLAVPMLFEPQQSLLHAIKAFEALGKEGCVKTGKINEVLGGKPNILVQILKEPIAAKGPRLSCEISLPGRFIVITPFNDIVAVSRKIHSADERKRLHKIIEAIK